MKWTEDEISVLRSQWPDVAGIASGIRRSERAVQHKGYNLGLVKVRGVNAAGRAALCEMLRYEIRAAKAEATLAPLYRGGWP